MSLELTPEEQSEVQALQRKGYTIHRRLKANAPSLKGECYPAFSKYTGLDVPLGQNGTHNSALAAWQLSFTMATQNHPLIDELITKPHHAFMPPKGKETHDVQTTIKEINELVREMVSQKILADLKILDLGCGPQPTYARCARELGADVFTLDAQESSDDFLKSPTFHKVHQEVENEQHLKLNMRTTNALEQITKKFGNNFDIITSAHLDTEWIGWRHLIADYNHIHTTVATLLKPQGWHLPLPSIGSSLQTARGKTLQRNFSNNTNI